MSKHVILILYCHSLIISYFVKIVDVVYCLQFKLNRVIYKGFT